MTMMTWSRWCAHIHNFTWIYTSCTYIYMTIYGVMPHCQGITLHVKHCQNIMLHINHQQKVPNLSRRHLQRKSSFAKVGHFEKWNAHFKSGMGILFFFHHDMSHQISWGFYFICNHCFTLVNALKMKHFHDKSTSKISTHQLHLWWVFVSRMPLFPK